jgi:hypothetical protein
MGKMITCVCYNSRSGNGGTEKTHFTTPSLQISKILNRIIAMVRFSQPLKKAGFLLGCRHLIVVCPFRGKSNGMSFFPFRKMFLILVSKDRRRISDRRDKPCSGWEKLQVTFSWNLFNINLSHTSKGSIKKEAGIDKVLGYVFFLQWARSITNASQRSSAYLMNRNWVCAV